MLKVRKIAEKTLSWWQGNVHYAEKKKDTWPLQSQNTREKNNNWLLV